MPRTPPAIRVFALPLTRTPRGSTVQPPIYWHVSQHVQQSADGSTKSDKEIIWSEPSTWPSSAIAKASDLWLAWGTKPTYAEQGKKQLKERVTEWKYWTWSKGEALMDKVEWEEWAYKSINPSVKVQSEKAVETDPMGVKTTEKISSNAPRIPFLIPGHSAIPSSKAVSLLKEHLETRIPYHKKYMYRAMIWIPITLPIGILPVVPNLPCFYFTWRAYSHYKAWKGAEWLLQLVEKDRLEVKVNDKLQAVLDISPTAQIGGTQSQAGDHAPDETSTPSGMTTVDAVQVKGENAIQQTDHLLADESPSASSLENRPADTFTPPNPESVNVAPDSTGTPASLIYNPTSDAPAKGSTNTFEKGQSEPYLCAENISKLTETFGLNSAEVVDLTRAVMQMRIQAEKASKESSK